MQCKIEWNSLPLAAWEERFNRVPRANLLQSYDYARAVCPLYRQRARWGLISIEGQEAGLVQILEASLLGGALHALVLDRGPLWFSGFGKGEHHRAFFTALNKAFPRRLGRRRRIIPETEDAAILEASGFKRLPRPGYQTAWLDLRPDTDTLRAGLKKNWRNMLAKAERNGMSLGWNEKEVLPWLLTNYQSDRAKKGYAGPSVRVLRALGETFAPRGRMLAGRAMLDNRPIAGILVLCHGTGATYQIGWSSDEGKKHGAHNLLLWQAVCRLKERGFTDLDLGGVNDDAEGIKKFKQGMGGETHTYAGHFL